MKVVLFGRLAETIAPELELEVPSGSPIAQLREALAASYPDAAPILSSRRAKACVGNEIVADAYVPGATEIVEFLPAVSGG